jgi:hypothetical protein
MSTTLQPKEQFRYSIFDCQSQKEWYQVSKPRKSSRFWASRYVVWDNLNNKKQKSSIENIRIKD